MSCYYPLVFRNLGLKENGKKRLLFIRDFTGNYEDYKSDKYELIPCGQCLGCRLDYANHWAERCCLEASQYTDNMFLTLTYDEAHCPLFCKKKDYQLFIKRLRNHFKGKEIRYFGVCERGSRSGRPHYHIIIFNAKFDDLKKRSRSGDNWLFTSETLEKLWPYGFCTVGECSYNSISYTARYVLKKVKSNIKTDEFLFMSRNPGIGSDYFYNNKNKLLKNELIYFPFSESKKQASFFRFYKKKIEEVSPDYFKEKKPLMLARINAKVISDLQQFGLKDEFTLNMFKKEIKEIQIKGLKRGL